MPRWVTNTFSRNSFPLDLTDASTETPLNGASCRSTSLVRVKGTSPGFVSSIFNPNWRAIRYPKSVAPNGAIERPPVAITSDCERSVRSSSSTSNCSRFATRRTVELHTTCTPASLHSFSSMSMIRPEPSSQNNWPSFCSWKPMWCFRTREMKSAGVYRASADLQKYGLAETKFSDVVLMFVKLQRPPPEMPIFLPTRSACSSTTTFRPRFPASMAQNSPAAPPPITITSASFTMKLSNRLKSASCINQHQRCAMQQPGATPQVG